MLKQRIAIFFSSAAIAFSFLFILNNSIRHDNFNEQIWNNNPNIDYPIIYIPVDVGTRAPAGCQSHYWQNLLGTSIGNVSKKYPYLIQNQSPSRNFQKSYFIRNEDGSALYFHTDKNGIIQQVRCH